MTGYIVIHYEREWIQSDFNIIKYIIMHEIKTSRPGMRSKNSGNDDGKKYIIYFEECILVFITCILIKAQGEKENNGNDDGELK